MKKKFIIGFLLCRCCAFAQDELLVEKSITDPVDSLAIAQEKVIAAEYWLGLAVTDTKIILDKKMVEYVAQISNVYRIEDYYKARLKKAEKFVSKRSGDQRPGSIINKLYPAIDTVVLSCDSVDHILHRAEEYFLQPDDMAGNKQKAFEMIRQSAEMYEDILKRTAAIKKMLIAAMAVLSEPPKVILPRK
ncbi:MAG: hypothetical protein ACJ77K_11980 [Bacteroidia bacterium]